MGGKQMAEAVRILHVLGTTELGGAESRIMDLYRHIDRNLVQFDFAVHTNKEGYFDKEITELGGRIFRVPRFRIYNYFSYRKAFKKLFREHREFKMVQGHITSSAAIYLPIAKKAGVSVTIAHARSAGVDKGMKGSLTRWMRRKLSEKTDYMFTCSHKAGVSVFGEKAVEQGKTIFIPNAIDSAQFAYHEEIRMKLRRELGLEDKYVIGHVGRFHYAKNHEYLLKIFAVLSGYDSRYELILLGEGGGMENIKTLARELGIADRVHFLGNHGNIYDYYQIMDYFVYPSRFEGLPGTVVEAQAAGLKCVISDTICKEVMITGLVHAMSIEEAPAVWADYIRNTSVYSRENTTEAIKQAGFDVNTQVEVMMDFYLTGKWKEAYE
jgi:glycosyltransferase involved in cell wall biosynthesis